jgi:hypothetical protein
MVSSSFIRGNGTSSPIAVIPAHCASASRWTRYPQLSKKPSMTDLKRLSITTL